MRIQHNVPALNAHRNLSNNNNALSKNLEKLSSGYRINRAGDDAAGLAISEKMRAQITGLQTAQKNAEDGVSLVQTAEGALTEVHSMLNRMVELATQSANGTYSDKNRLEMQKEIDALTKEIDRISNTANFNGTKLFKKVAAADGADGAGAATQAAGETRTEGVTDIAGTLGGAPIAAGTPVAATKEKWVAGAAHTVVDNGPTQVKISYKDASGASKEKTLSITGTAGNGSDFGTELVAAVAADNDLKDLFTVKDNAKILSFETKTAGVGKGSITGVEIAGTALTKDNAASVAGADETQSFDLSKTAQAGDKVTIDGKDYTFDANADGTDGEKFKDLATLKVAAAKNGVTLDIGTSTAVTATKEVQVEDNNTETAGDEVVINLHVGESSENINTIEVKIKAMSSKSLGIFKKEAGATDGAAAQAEGADGEKAATGMIITSAADAKAAIDTINNAIDEISSIRSDLGALQNRLEHTINNLGVQTENITAAESRIRDVDMAKEMMAYTKNNILVQASQAMLAQANQVPQGVLQLLQ